MSNYYIDSDGKKKGPFTLNQLRSMWNSGAITGRNLYCEESGDKWRKLEMMRSVLETGVTQPKDAEHGDTFVDWLRTQFEKFRGIFKG